DAPPPGDRARDVPPGHPGPPAGRPGAGPRRRPGLRDPRRPQGAGRAGPRPPPAAHPRGPAPRHDGGGGPRRGAARRARPDGPEGLSSGVLTRQGWLAVVGAALLIAGGRVLGQPELFALGLATALLPVLAAASVLARRLDLEVGRSVHPVEVQVGTPTRVDLRIRNRRIAPTPVLRLREPVSGTRGADLRVA